MKTRALVTSSCACQKFQSDFVKNVNRSQLTTTSNPRVCFNAFHLNTGADLKGGVPGTPFFMKMMDIITM